MKTFAVGDIHGAYKSLVQCLERSKFDYNNDRLIVLNVGQVAFNNGMEAASCQAGP